MCIDQLLQQMVSNQAHNSIINLDDDNDVGDLGGGAAKVSHMFTPCFI